MKTMLRTMLGMAMILALCGIPAFAAGQSEKDVIALVTKAAQYYNDNGQEKAFAAFSDKNGEFQKGGLYLFMFQLDGLCIFNAVNAKLIGKNHQAIEDVNGKKFIQEMIDVVKAKGSGWTDYMYKNPETGKIDPKTTYALRIKGKDMLIACGIYK